MDIYSDYSEFLQDLTRWGGQALEPEDGFHPSEILWALLKKAARSADHEVFSPFLYLTLSARLERPDILLLAAALYLGLYGEALDLSAWEQFSLGEDKASIRASMG